MEDKQEKVETSGIRQKSKKTKISKMLSIFSMAISGLTLLTNLVMILSTLYSMLFVLGAKSPPAWLYFLLTNAVTITNLMMIFGVITFGLSIPAVVLAIISVKRKYKSATSSLVLSIIAIILAAYVITRMTMYFVALLSA